METMKTITISSNEVDTMRSALSHRELELEKLLKELEKRNPSDPRTTGIRQRLESIHNLQDLLSSK